MKIKNRETLFKNLWLYKSIFFRNKKFTLESDDPIVNIIINALNIKKRKERINYIYDSTCKYIDDDVKGKNICGFKDGKCYVQQLKENGINGCCRRCIYQSDKGCLTSNLTCKLFNCGEVKCRHNVIVYDDLKMLKVLSLRQRVILKHSYFSSREEVLKDLYIGSLFIFGIRLVIRVVFKNFKWF